MMEVTIHGSILPDAGGATALSFEPFPAPHTMTIDGQEKQCETIAWEVRLPDDAKLIRDSRGVLSLKIEGMNYSANQVFALAQLELAGFSLAGEVSAASTG